MEFVSAWLAQSDGHQEAGEHSGKKRFTTSQMVGKNATARTFRWQETRHSTQLAKPTCEREDSIKVKL
jgi:hypothetical protein